MKFPWDKENIKRISYPDGSSYVEVESFPPQIEFRINSYEDLYSVHPADHVITPIKSWINKKLKENISNL